MPVLPGAAVGDYYQSEKEIKAVVEGFESCTTGADDFKHRDHLTVAVWYLRNSSPEQAFQRMCSGLLRFLDHHGVGRAKYDERLTMKWIRLIQDAIEEMNPDLSLLEVTNIVIERFGDSRVLVDSSSSEVQPLDCSVSPKTS
jgi:hypothetical protein